MSVALSERCDERRSIRIAQLSRQARVGSAGVLGQASTTEGAQWKLNVDIWKALQAQLEAGKARL